MRKSWKRNSRRLLSLLVAVTMCLFSLPPKAEAWKILSHVNSADIILLDMQRSANLNGGQAKVTVKVPYSNGASYTYNIPAEYQEAILGYPDAFRAGSMGPDIYPDLMTGQGNIHPYYNKTKNGVTYRVASGEWITLLCNSVNMLPRNSSQRKQALAFTLGYMLHYCGDMFGHDFINSFAGGTYPDLDTVNYLDGTDRNLNIILSHSSEETYMDSLINHSFYKNNGYLGISAPIQFVADSMLFDGNVNNGAAKIFNNYGGVPAIYEYLINLRMTLYNLAESWRPSCEVAHTTAVKYLDAWIKDIDDATYALVKCFDNIGKKMINEKKPDMLKIVKDELMDWGDKYGKYITIAPDVAIDGIFSITILKDALNKILDAIGLNALVKDLEKWLEDQIMDLALSALGFVGLNDVIDIYKVRFSKPEEQLDNEQNPFRPSSDNFAEFDEYMQRYAEEQNLLSSTSPANIIAGRDGGVLDRVEDSELEAFYNTIVMFKLILMGPDNFTSFIRTLSGENQTQYQNNTANLVASSLDITIKTANITNAGTDSNIYLEVYKNNSRIIKKLLDKSGYNDFEQGKTDTYTVELREPVRLDQLNLKIVQEGTSTLASGWDCENVSVATYHAGIKLHDAIGLGGRYGMDDGKTWNLPYHDKLMDRATEQGKRAVTSLYVEIETKSNSYWTEDCGTDSTVYLDVYNDGKDAGSYELNNPGDDFKNGATDRYNIYLSGNVPLDKLTTRLRLDGSDAWKVQKVYITPYQDEIKLANTSTYNGTVTLEKSSWYLGSLNGSLLSYTPLVLSYTTNVDDGLASTVMSLDDSLQWKVGSGLLWNNETVRSKVFFKIFKGFSPEISLNIPSEIYYTDTLNGDVSLEGMWNGTRKSRRDKVLKSEKMPDPNGKVKVTFLKNGREICSTEQNVTNGVLSLKNYSSRDLLPGVYDVRVNFTANTSNQQYADSAKTFERALTVNKKSVYNVKFRVVNGKWNDGTSDEREYTLTGDDLIRHLQQSQIPSAGNNPYGNTYKAGGWNIEPTTETEITNDTVFTYTYAPKLLRSTYVDFRVENGRWNDGGNSRKTVRVSAYEDQPLKLSSHQIPAVGDNPYPGYKTGKWSADPLATELRASFFSNNVFIYRYEPKAWITPVVTFKVVNGSWDDGSTENKKVSFNGYEGDVFNLKASQIPEVGNKPDDEHKAGTWDIDPTAAQITGNVTFTYTYADDKTVNHTVTFKVVNGSWDDGTTADKTVNLSGKESETLSLSDDHIPAVGQRPKDNTFKEGSWNVTPDTKTAITADTTYVYTYTEKTELEKTVKFKVLNGSWDDGTTDVKTVTLKGYEGDLLTLAEEQIPAVGTKPDNTYKEGSWDVTPDTETVISDETTYTYTYARKEAQKTVKFKVVNGSWNDGSTDEKSATVNGYEGDEFKLSASDIPAVGQNPDNTCKAGSWDVKPDTTKAVTDGAIYTYTYAKKAKLNKTVKFKVICGSWDDGTVEEKTVTLSGLEGDVLKLAADDIPAVGTKPDKTYKSGAWNTTPDTDTAITKDMTYTYTYTRKAEIGQNVIFKVVNGSWDDGTSTDKIVNVTGFEGDVLKLNAEAIPAVGTKPGDIYKAGDWDSAPDTSSELTKETTYTYTYAEKEKISQTVTFKVVNGLWDDGTSGEKTVTVNGYEGDALKLTADDIPAVGTKPGDIYKAGIWDVTPDTSTGISEDTTYTYTYVEKDKIIVTFDVDGGSQITSQVIYSGDTVTAPNDPEKESYVFAGWYADEELKVPFDFTAGVYTETVVYAAWEAITYKVNGDVDHKEGSDEDAVIIVKRSHADDTCFAHFTGVRIDGQLLTEGTDYTAVPGSTVITLKAATLNKLSTGTHTVTAEFDDGQAAAQLTVKAKSDNTQHQGENNNNDTSPRTGAAAAGMGVIALAAAAIIASKKKK